MRRNGSSKRQEKGPATERVMAKAKEKTKSEEIVTGKGKGTMGNHLAPCANYSKGNGYLIK